MDTTLLYMVHNLKELPNSQPPKGGMPEMKLTRKNHTLKLTMYNHKQTDPLCITGSRFYLSHSPLIPSQTLLTTLLQNTFLRKYIQVMSVMLLAVRRPFVRSIGQSGYPRDFAMPPSPVVYHQL